MGPDGIQQVFELLKRHGWNATSFQCLEPGFSYWFSADGDACVAYVEAGGAWVAGGAPIAAETRLASVTKEFVASAHAVGRRVAFFAVERRFLDASGLDCLLIGEQPVWDPGRWSESLERSRNLRTQLRRAAAKGVTVRPLGADSIGGDESPRRRLIDRLIGRWRARHRLPPMGFLVQVYLYSFPTERRFFAAERNGQLVGLLVMVPIYARGGWLFEDLLRDPDAPNGTAELLIDIGMRAADAEGSQYATLGLAPLAGRVSGWLRTAARLGSTLYNFDGVRAFKARLEPMRWERIYLAYPAGQRELATVRDALSAFAHGKLIRFGLRSLVRSPDVVVRALTVLLLPWTALLALAAPDRWFPASWVRWAWVAFDVGLIGGLAALWGRWRSWLGVMLAGLISADAVVTGAEVLTFNARLGARALEWVMLVAAVLGPTLAAGFLWAVVRNRATLPPRD